MIRVYNGYGASELAQQTIAQRFNHHRIKACSISAEKIKASEFQKDTDILVFGGKSVTQFKQALGEQGLDAIKTYVENGGHYLGICAGGYFGAKQIDFVGRETNGDLYTKQAKGLGFFNGIAKGSLTEVASPYTGTADSAEIMTIATHKDSIKYQTLYWGGPQFIPNNEHPKKDTRILSHFNTATGDNLIMGVQCDVGDKGGKATLLGYHPEVSDDNIKRWVLPSGHFNQHSQKLYERLHYSTSADTYSVNAAFTFLLYQLGLRDEPQKKPHIEKSI